MPAELIDGRAVAARVRSEVTREVATLVQHTGRPPGLATILVGDDPASAIYVANKRKACGEVGIADHHRHLSVDASAQAVAAAIEECNQDAEVSGILLQLPLPSGLDGAALSAQIAPVKDVDGLTPISAGLLVQGSAGLRPCTPVGVIALLDAYAITIESTQAVIVGRSNLVGKPLAALLLQRNATVTICHSRTRELMAVCARADLLIAAAGVPGLLGRDHIAQGAVVIDVGMNRTDEGLRGDVDFDAALERARLITPVPGGVGPMTIAMLLRNTVQAARIQAGLAA